MKRGRSLSAPNYLLHKKSGQARVIIHGQTYYLGKHGSEESWAKYRRLIVEKWNPPGTEPAIETTVENEPVTITRLAVEYAIHARKYYLKNGKPTTELGVVNRVLKRLRTTYGDLTPDEFGPVRYKMFREEWINDGLKRTTVNHYMKQVQLMFKYAVELQLIPVERFQALKCVPHLKRGRSPAKESGKIRPVDPAIVQATLKKLTPVLADMARLQQLTGMRPGEVCSLRPCDVDRSGKTWKYEPQGHKTQHHEHRRVVSLGKEAQKLLTPYLLRDHQAFCFTPREAYLQDLEKRNDNRRTPAKHGNQATGRRNRSFRPAYTHETYRRAIQRAALRAFPYPDDVKEDPAQCRKWDKQYKWSPNQLRHLVATVARREFGLETSQQILGHSSKTTTERYYAELDLSLADEFALKFG